MELLNDAKNIKKSWLLCFKVRIWLKALLLAVFPLFVLFFDPPVALTLFFFAAIVFLIFGIFAWIEYRCAYKSPGTKFLIFSMIMAIYGTLLSSLLLAPLYIWDIITSYKLRELNKAILKNEKKPQKKRTTKRVVHEN